MNYYYDCNCCKQRSWSRDSDRRRCDVCVYRCGADGKHVPKFGGVI